MARRRKHYYSTTLGGIAFGHIRMRLGQHRLWRNLTAVRKARRLGWDFRRHWVAR